MAAQFEHADNLTRRPAEAGDVLAIKIDPSIIDPTDADFLEELVLKGVQDAISQGKAQAAAEMSKLTGGLGIPGL